MLLHTMSCSMGQVTAKNRARQHLDKQKWFQAQILQVEFGESFRMETSYFGEESGMTKNVK